MNNLDLPVTRYAANGDINIAYQVMGTGPVDIIIVPGVVSHIEFMHELVGYTAFLRRLSTFARVVTFDKRGQGLSDRISGAPSLEQRMDDVRAVMDEVGSSRAASREQPAGLGSRLTMNLIESSNRASHVFIYANVRRNP